MKKFINLMLSDKTYDAVNIVLLHTLAVLFTIIVINFIFVW